MRIPFTRVIIKVMGFRADLRGSLVIVLLAVLVSCMQQNTQSQSSISEQTFDAPIHDAKTAASIRIQSPLSTVYESPQKFDAQATAIELSVELTGAESSWTGCGVYLSDDEGNWLCSSSLQALRPGVQNMSFKLDAKSMWNSPLTKSILN
ncbi:MAG: hypothetical protein HRU15_15390, partial [Planctomycetes bacterium]|nr:hypothetical protein [Planctomycetota bacterium]